MKLKMLVIVLTLALTIAGAQELKGTSGNYKSEIDKEFNVNTGGMVKVETQGGDIEVHSWNKNKVAVHVELKIRSFTKGEAKEVLKRLNNSITKTGNNINVELDFNRMPVSAKVVLTTPKDFNLDVRTSGGDILIQEIDGKSMAHTSGGDITLQKINGPAEVKTSGGDIKLETIKGKVSARTSGGDISLHDIHAPVAASTSGGDIDVKDIFAEIEIKTSGGNLDITNVENDIEAKTSGGDISVHLCKGDVNVGTSGGDINLTQINGQVNAHTSGGDISGSALQNSVSVKTSGGDIHLDEIGGAVAAKTSGGNINLELTGENLKASDKVECLSSGGSVELTIPADLGADVDAKIKIRSKRDMNRYDIYSDFALVKKESKEDDEIVSTGDINGGGVDIQLQTTNGNIRIHKK